MSVQADDASQEREAAGRPGAKAASAQGLLAALAALAVLYASLGNFVTYHDYPLLRPEVAWVAGGLMLLAFAVGAIYWVGGHLLRALLEATLVFLAVDLNSGVAWPAVLAGGAIFLLCYLRRVSVLRFVAIIAAVALLATLLGVQERRPSLARLAGQSAAPRSGGPAIVHIILDEHAGLGGLRDPQARRELSQFYVSRGFRLFSRAYSHHFHTVNAIPEILNFGAGGNSEASREHLRTGRTAYLGLLARRGYAINVYESDFADFCSDVAFASCTRYWSPSIAFLEGLPLSTREKAWLIAFKFAGLSNLAIRLTRTYNGLVAVFGPERKGPPRIWLERWGLSSTLSGLAAFDALTADLRRARRGNVYFAHLLVPHYPYVAEADCAILPPSQWEYRRSVTPLAGREEAYARQLRCAMAKLDGALRALAQSPAGDDAIVIVHGDHGSRIVASEPRSDRVGRFSEDDLVAGFSTLFVVRGPGIPTGIEPAPAAASDLLASLARSDFRNVEPPRRPLPRSVLLDDRDWIPRRRVPLPAEWQQ
ncbi:MAG: hypothetical protein M3177_04845 [Pseudomonadota bacterium]|nr:hypothetical protein [Pseudomonadota bacterium]